MNMSVNETVKILVIEDNPNDVLLIKTMLDLSGNIISSIDTAGYLNDGLNLLAREKYDVILLDLGLPDSLMGETLEKVAEKAGKIPIIVLTVNYDDVFALDAIKKGAQDYLIKGKFDTDLLVRSIRYAIERVRAEKAMKDSEEWERTFNTIDDMISILDNDMRIIRTNNAALQMTGISPEKLTGRYCYEIFREKNAQCEDCPAKKVLEINTAVTQEIECHNEKIIQATISPFYDKNRNFFGFIHVAKDISQTKKMEAQLRHSQKMGALATMAGGIAHHFNNIMFVILGFTEMCIDELPKGSIRDNMNQVMNAAQRASNMVKQLLFFSRQDNINESDRVSYHLQSIIKESIIFFRDTIPADIKIETDIDNNCSPVIIDRDLIHHVIIHLFTNACNAMKEKGGVLKVSLEETKFNHEHRAVFPEIKPGKYARLTVTDTGCGMDRAVMDKIFDPYFTTRDVSEGTGLGLSVCHGIIRKHHGYITVNSTPGKGSVFNVYLPLSKQESIIDDLTDYKAFSGNEHILVIDDEESIVFMIQQMLEKSGYTVTALTESSKVPAVFSKDPAKYDLIITDMSMPEMDGIELSEKIVNIRNDIPIIICAGSSEYITKENTSADICEYIVKPVDRYQILKTIRRVLDQRK